MNEQHALLPEQERILKEKFESYDILKVPADGWTLEEIENQIKDIINEQVDTVICVSPIPYLINRLSSMHAWYEANVHYEATFDITKSPKVLIFHNDNRVKKELPNGKIISVVAQEGWQLI